MLLVSIVFFLVVLFNLILVSFMWCGLGKLIRIENLTFKKAFLTSLIILLVGVALQAIILYLNLLQLDYIVFDAILSLAGLVVIIWMIKNRFNTTILKAIGLHVSAIALGVCLALSIRIFVIQPFKIPTGAMRNTILVGDHVLVKKYIYKSNQPKRGDIIVFKFPKNPSKNYIKRVVAIGGDTLEIRDKKVYVNGQLQDHAYAIHVDQNVFPVTACGEDGSTGMHNLLCRRDNLRPLKIPENKLFMMGDNRDQSNDSRFWGVVDMEAVLGKAFFIYWSWDKNKLSMRWSRIGNSL